MIFPVQLSSYSALETNDTSRATCMKSEGIGINNIMLASRSASVNQNTRILSFCSLYRAPSLASTELLADMHAYTRRSNHSFNQSLVLFTDKSMRCYYYCSYIRHSCQQQVFSKGS